MKKVSLCLVIAAALPLLASAATSNVKATNQALRADRRSDIQSTYASNTQLRAERKNATSTADKKALQSEIKDNRQDLKQQVASSTNAIIANYAAAMNTAINARILSANNILSRLSTGSTSILVLLQNSGKDVTAIQAKFAVAQADLNKASTDLATANALAQSINNQTASSTPTRANYMAVRLAFRTAENDYKLAYQALVAGRNLIKEIPGANSLGSQGNNIGTSTGTSTN